MRNDEEVLSVIRLYNKGYSMTKVSELTGVPRTTIKNILYRHNVKTRPGFSNKITEEEIDNILDRLKAGETKTDIARSFGVTLSAISHLLKRRRGI